MSTITVVGSGIVGLTSAIALQEAGFQVKLIAKERYDATLSSKVGAIWFPFEIHPKEKANAWAALAYKRYQTEAKKGNGVSFIPFITTYTSESNTDWTKQLPDGAVRDALKDELPNGIEKAFRSIVPLAEPHLYLPHLFDRFLNNDGSFTQQTITSLQELANLDIYVINCTGLGAKVLCDDGDLQPMRGQILRCKKMNIPSFADSTQKGGLSYLINRNEDCIIGGTDYENDWNRNVEKSDTDLILNRFKARCSSQEGPEILETLVGLRPLRKRVRFEFDSKHTHVFHNYGHGGAGFTVAWGCAMELAGILKSSDAR